MAPHSDVDFTVVCEHEEDVGAANALGEQLNLIRAAKGDPFNADPAISGKAGMSLADLIETAVGLDLVVVSGEPKVLDCFRVLYLFRHDKREFLKGVKDALSTQGPGLLDKKRSISATAKAKGWSETEVNVKNNLLRFLMKTMAALAALMQAQKPTGCPCRR